MNQPKKYIFFFLKIIMVSSIIIINFIHTKKNDINNPPISSPNSTISEISSKEIDPSIEPTALPPITKIVVNKSQRQLCIYNQETLLKTYTIALGFDPIGHKEQEGDGKTPEGLYRVCAKNPNSAYHKSLKVSYPNSLDKKQAKEKGVPPGDHIMIHGLGKNFSSLGKNHIKKDWTLGCIALTDEEIEEIFTAADIGTTIQINP